MAASSNGNKPDNMHAFGLGSCLITEEQELSILVAAGWDGESAAFPVIREWLAHAIQSAILTVELQHGKLIADDIRDAYERKEWARDYVPEKEKETA